MECRGLPLDFLLEIRKSTVQPDPSGMVLEKLRTHRKEQWLNKGKPVPEWVFCNEEGNYLNELKRGTGTQGFEPR